MKSPRFILTDNGLILETAIPLSGRQRDAARLFAINEYKRRLAGLFGQRKDTLIKVIRALQLNQFDERAIPAHDCDKETLIYG